MKKFSVYSLLIVLILSFLYTELKAQSKYITFSPEFVVPTGQFAQKTGTGGGASIKFEIKMKKNYSFFINGGYFAFSGKTFKYPNNTSYLIYYNIGEVIAGLTFYEKKGYFFSFGASVNFFYTKSDISQGPTGQVYTYFRTESTEKYGLFVGAGYLYPLDELFSVEGMIRYHYLGDNSSFAGLRVGLKIDVDQL
ncbi:MAG: hypothetical protein HUU43_02905 [Ignavibacteriaceae bacterium]|nr:hypothetical protein [Ignavibacteriaceae bacterium]NUM69772.1 hypothetical protein [Ignavibacteriaceae bacterium]